MAKKPSKDKEPFRTAYLPIKSVLSGLGEEAAGAALLKVDAKLALFLTDHTDNNLWLAYSRNMERADKAAEKIESAIDSYLSGVSNGYTVLVLTSAFHDAFGRSYGDWRKSLH